MHHKKALTLSNFTEKTTHFIFSFTNFMDTKYLIKLLFNEVKTKLEHRLNKLLDKDYMQVVYVICLCVYCLENN